MPDPRVDAVAAVVSRVEGAACGLARRATRAAVTGAAAGLVLWWFTAGDRIDEWWQGSLASVVVLALCLAPALWLANVRVALIELVELPDTLAGVASRRAAVWRATPNRPTAPPKGGLLAAIRTVRGVVQDYGDVVGSWGTIAQLVAPPFWLLTALAFLAVPVLGLVAAVTLLIKLL